MDELQEAFGALIEDTGKLPKLSVIEDRIKGCKLLHPHVLSERLSISAIKNKVDRIYNVTLRRPHKP